MKAAYWQCALMAAQPMIAITAVYDPTTDKVDYHEMWGQPFGAGQAVPNFYRAAEWCAQVYRHLLWLIVNHFFDDFFLLC